MIYTFENYLLDVQRRELRRGNEFVPLEPGVFDLLQYLVCNRQRVLSKEDLIAAVWNGRIVSESTLSGRINAVRSALADDGEQQRLLRTFPRKGFRFVGQVRERAHHEEAIAAAPTAFPGPVAAITPCDAREPERRQLTIMACDLVGLAALSTRLDPEELREIVATFHDRARGVVERHGGFIARFLPEGVLVYFGYPQAHEDDAERAVRAALATVGVQEFGPSSHTLRARAGLATGLVVIDGSDHTPGRDRVVIGETPLLANRMLALAAPATVVVSAGVRRLVGKLFEYRRLAADDPGGDAASQVIGESANISRFAALRGVRTPRLVGRDEPIELLLRRWSRAASGEGQLVLLAGEPGIGKSRLIAEFDARLGRSAGGSLHYSCQPHWQENALGPVIVHLEREFQLASTDSPAEKSRKVRAIIGPTLPAEDVALIAGLLGAAGAPQQQHLDLGPQSNRSRTFAALCRWIVKRARAAPLLMVVEDAHWADPSSLEFFDGLIALLPTAPLLLVMSFRPEFAAPWIGNANTTLLSLARLGRSESAELARQVAGEDKLAPAIVDRIVAQADGIPLFIEELTMAVREANGRAGEIKQPSVVPITLQASLTARLDRLRTGKKLAQIGAVIGRDFSYRMLSAVATSAATELAQGLAELVASGLVHVRGAPPDASYVFKHALVQEAAYESLLRSERTGIHRAVVAAAEAARGETMEPNLLAHHCAQAGLTKKAASYYRLAGEQAAARSAVQEMRQQFERALAYAASLPPSPDRDHLECELLLALGHVLLVTKGNADAEALAVFGRAGALCRRLKDSEALTRSLYSQASILVHRGEPRTAQVLSEELLSLAAAERNGPARMAALVRAGHIACLQGRFADARKNLSAALAMNGSGPGLAAAAVSSPDRTAAAHLALALTCRGESALAARQINAIGQRPHTILPSSMIVLLTIVPPNDERTLQAIAEEQQSLAEEHGFPYFLALARCLHGWTRAKQDAADGLRILTDALASLRALGVRAQEPWALGLVSDALALTGHHAEALATLTDALASSQATGIAWFDAELHRRRAQLLLQAQADPADAERALRQSLRIAREQSAKLFERRAAASLMELRKRLPPLRSD